MVTFLSKETGQPSEDRSASSAEAPKPFDRDVDLGVLSANTIPQHVFLVKNTTPNPFTIVEIKKSCGCNTVGVKNGHVVQAGEILKVSYQLPSNANGPVSEALLLKTDSKDKQFSLLTFSLKAVLPTVISATPDALLFDQAHGPAKQVRVQSDIKGMFDNTLKISTIRGLVDIEVLERTGSELLLNVSLRQDPPDGDAHDVIKVLVDASPKSYVRIKVRSNSNLLPR